MWGHTIASITLMVFILIGYFIVMGLMFDDVVKEVLGEDDTYNNF